MPTVEEVIKAYVETRDAIKEKTDVFNKSLEAELGFQKAREQWLHEEIKRIAGDDATKGSIKTAAGTAFLKKNEWVKVAAWRTFLREALLTPVVKAIMEEKALESYSTDELLTTIEKNFPSHLITEAVCKTEILEIMGKDRDKPAPPGIDYGSMQVVQVHRGK